MTLTKDDNMSNSFFSRNFILHKMETCYLGMTEQKSRSECQGKKIKASMWFKEPNWI